MTDDLAPLYRAVWEAPEDDTARLVLADCLEESGQWQRADAVRRGVAKPKRFTFAPGAPAVLAYTSERRDDSRGRVVEVALAPGIPGVRWTTWKGLVEGATCDWGAWLERSALVLTMSAALPEVVLTTAPELACDMNLDTGRDHSSWLIPGRQTVYKVGAGQDPIATVLSGEWPQVKQFLWPEPVHAVRRDGWWVTVEGDELGGAPNVGDIVRCLDGSEGVLVAHGAEPGTGAVRPLPPGAK